jgi:hypothetical protein
VRFQCRGNLRSSLPEFRRRFRDIIHNLWILEESHWLAAADYKSPSFAFDVA